MTVETLTVFSGPYTGTGAEDQEFPVEFQAAGDDEIEVTLDGVAIDSSLWSFDRDDDGRGTLTATLAGEVYIQSKPSFAQEADFQRYGPYFPDDVNAPLDRAAIRDQYLNDRLDRSPVAPRDGSWNGMFAAVDAGGDWTPASGTGADAALRSDLASAAGTGASLISFKQLGSFAILRDLQARNREFKLTSDTCAMDGTNSDHVGFYGLANEVSASGGGTLILPPNKTLLLTQTQTLPQKIKINLNGSRLLMRLVGIGDEYNPGFRLFTGCGIENGVVEMDSSGDPGDQLTQHACINAGPMYGEGGTAEAPSVLHDTQDIFVRNIEFISNAAGKTCIAVIGGVSGVDLENIRCPDPGALSGIINMDWGSVGNVDTSGGGDAAATFAAIAATRTRFNSGLAWSLHPHNIRIKGVFVGSMTGSLATVVRTSSVYDLDISHVYADQVNAVNGAAIFLTGGDVGREFMLPTDAPKALKNITADHIHMPDCGESYGLRLDTAGDNIRISVGEGYVPRFNPTVETNLVIRDSVFGAGGDSSAADGATIAYMMGGKVVNCVFRGFRKGMLLDNGCVGVTISGNTTIYNRQHGQVADGTTRPYKCRIEQPISYLNGTAEAGATKYAQVALLSAKSCTIDGGEMGDPLEGTETASYGIKLEAAASGGEGNRIMGQPLIHSHKAAGAAHFIGSDESFGCCGLFAGARYGAGVTVRHAGLSIIPTQMISGSAADITIYYAARAKLGGGGEPPAAFPGKVGDRIKITDPVTTGYEGARCITAGTPGTWEYYGASTA